MDHVTYFAFKSTNTGQRSYPILSNGLLSVGVFCYDLLPLKCLNYKCNDHRSSCLWLWFIVWLHNASSYPLCLPCRLHWGKQFFFQIKYKKMLYGCWSRTFILSAALTVTAGNQLLIFALILTRGICCLFSCDHYDWLWNGN